MKFANLHQAKTQLSMLIELALKGERVIICKSGKPTAEIIVCNMKNIPRVADQYKNTIKIADDFDQLPEDFMSNFGGK